MSAPVLTARQRREVADRYRDGLTIPQLAEIYGTCGNAIQRALIKEGVPRRRPHETEGFGLDWMRECRECGQAVHKNAVRLLCIACAKRFCRTCEAKLPDDWRSRHCSDCRFKQRYEKRPPRLCRVCGRMGARGSKRDLCSVHIKTFCKGCDTGLPPNRVHLYCPQCEHDKKQRLWEKEGRVCCQCGEREAGNHSSRCAHCLHEEYEVMRYARLHLDRPCLKCGETLTRGRRVNYCPPCQLRREKERRRQKRLLGVHRCAMCREDLPLTLATYCHGCQTMINNWRKAWHAGDPAARALGTVRTQKRWQEKAG